jgi:hypothetical protein
VLQAWEMRPMQEAAFGIDGVGEWGMISRRVSDMMQDLSGKGEGLF